MNTKNCNDLFNKIPDFKNDLLKLCKKNQYNVVLNNHLGDTFTIMSFHKELKNKLKKPIHFLIQPSQEIVMELYKYKNYTVVDLNTFIDPYVKKYFKDKVSYVYFKISVFEYFLDKEPKLDVPFILSSNSDLFKHMIKEYGYQENFLHGWAYQIGLNIKKVDFKINCPSLSDKASKEIQKIAPLNKIVLIAPEAKSDYMLNKNVWNLITKKIMNLGYVVVENITDKKNHIDGAITLNLSLKDVIALGYACNSVFALRSGLCDVLSGKGKDLYVLYRKERWVNGYFSFQKYFNIKNNNYPNEIILDQNLKPKIIWNNINLLKNIPTKYLYKPSYLKILKIRKYVEKCHKHYSNFIKPFIELNHIFKTFINWLLSFFKMLYYLGEIIIRILLNFWRLF